jgi:arylsulfatase A-like enzyme
MNRRTFNSLLPAAAVALTRPARAQQRKPNFVVFLVDDMGYADLSSYGAKDIQTPNIDRIAREGIRFTDAYSNGPVCTPTRAALMTGRYQQRFGLEWAISPGMKEPGLEQRHTTIARFLKNDGYATALIGKWHLGYKPEYGPNAHGFDRFFGILSGNVDHYSHRENNGEADLLEDGKPVEREGYMTDLLADEAAKWLDANHQRPFFLYFAFNTVHWPFQAPGRPKDVRTRSTWFEGTRADYVRMMKALDDAVGRVLARLDQYGMTKNTMVIFTNDNGGERLSDNSPLFHHKGTLWEGGIRVPLAVRWPERIPKGQVSNAPVATMDLPVTVVAAAGLKEGLTRADGVNLLPHMMSKHAVPERTLFWRINRAGRNQRAARRGDWKYISDAGIEMLVNLREDLGERRDLGYRHPEKKAELREALRAWEADVDSEKPRFQVL